ncbi:hypothetical protein FRC04_002517 [Tulasnella sp. 424]|nr:hypothetical protein FRC04_002517 [Tulasnella sp. 424]KAG8966490.1 hypothetical protein FRC05_002630 [Tulasnella sp. 425]
MAIKRTISIQPSAAQDENLLSDSWRQGLNVDQFNAKFEKILNDCNSGSGPKSCPQNGDKLIDAIYKLGYSMLIATPEELYDFYRRHHRNVHLVIRDSEVPYDDLYNTTYVYADIGENSINSIPVPPPNATNLNLPIWKVFHPMWWNQPFGPLGGPFTLSPEPYEIWPSGWNGGKDNFYLGYTVEPSCMNTPYIPHAQRPRQAYIFGKYLGYFGLKDYTLYDEKGGLEASINDDFYVDFAQKENITFLAGHFSLFQVPDGYKDPPRGIVQHERLPRPEFQKTVSNSRVMIGLGNPLLSPTPYEALCLGIPFINPVRRHDPNNKMMWEGQHPALIYGGLDEPYVYHVQLGDREEYKAALRKAMSTPIDRYIPPRMRSSAFLGRMQTLLETDWRPVAKKQMQLLGYTYHS